MRMNSKNVLLTLTLIVSLIGVCCGVAWLALAAMAMFFLMASVIVIDAINKNIKQKKFRAIAWSVPLVLLLMVVLFMLASANVLCPLYFPFWLDITLTVISLLIIAYYLVCFCIALGYLITNAIKTRKHWLSKRWFLWIAVFCCRFFNQFLLQK